MIEANATGVACPEHGRLVMLRGEQGRKQDKEVGMKGNRFIRTLLVIAAFWALLALYTP